MQGREISFYISQPIGPGAAARSFGFRLDQHSNPGSLPGGTSSAAELSGRRELVNLHMAAHENLRIDFGRHVSWDFGRHQFTQPGEMLPMKAAFPIAPCLYPTPPLRPTCPRRWRAGHLVAVRGQQGAGPAPPELRTLALGISLPRNLPQPPRQAAAPRQNRRRARVSDARARSAGAGEARRAPRRVNPASLL